MLARHRAEIALMALLLAGVAATSARAADAARGSDATNAAQVAEAAKPVAGTRYMYLIRHGFYDRDASVTDDRVGNGLNAKGHAQAKLAGRRLASLPVRIHALVSSDFVRAAQTADDIGRVLGMRPVLDSLLHECTPDSDREDNMKDQTPEETALCEANLEAAWAKYFAPSPAGDTHDALVAHGNVIRWLVSKALANDTRHWTRMDIANASLTVIAVRPDGLARLVMFSDVSHIPIETQTWSGKGAGWGAMLKGMR